MKKNITIIILSFILQYAGSQSKIDNTELLPEVVIKGEGETTLLLIPCMSCRWNAWEEFMERNRDKYTMYAVTVPGYGGTPAPDLPKNTNKTPWRDNVIKGLSELIDLYKLSNVVVVGHSWGSMLAVQLAAQRPKVVTKVISVDGTIESNSWTPSTKKERIAQAEEVIKDWETKLQNAEEWSKFNGASVGNVMGKNDSITRETMLYRIKLLTSFMATDRSAMLQYWRENPLIDLTAHLHKVKVPILDIQSFTGKDQQQQKEKHLKNLQEAKVPLNVETVFMFDTKHFIMYHRPEQLDCMMADFINGKKISDYASESSEYFEELATN